MADSVKTPVSVAFAGAGSPTLQTAITNYNTAAATAVATAQGQALYPAGSGATPQSLTASASNPITVNPPTTIWDGTNYVISGSLSYFKFVVPS